MVTEELRQDFVGVETGLFLEDFLFDPQRRQKFAGSISSDLTLGLDYISSGSSQYYRGVS
ncbi:hypothetical protein OUZ56_016110 [Daphnia magna]|uniref:Uncharacterized protein n=1 Tax=Daphnia magna TaxID=35525 RepID=A0ABR0APP6_9CRUS|nr:hypothetical protein OUZ56_016110 [Daphnia magna]